MTEEREFVEIVNDDGSIGLYNKPVGTGSEYAGRVGIVCLCNI